MKKLLSILAGLTMTATTATTVVSCSWGCSSDKKGSNIVTPTKEGNVTFEYSATVDQEIKDVNQLNDKYKVMDSNGNLIPNAHIEVEPNDPSPYPLQAGKKYKFKVTYDIPDYDSPAYDGTKDRVDHIKEVLGADGTKLNKPNNVQDINVKNNNNNPLTNPDYVGWTGNDSDKGVAKMGDTKIQSSWESDGKGYYKGYNDDGKPLSDGVSIDSKGYPVDTTGDSNSNKGFGKRIVIGNDGKPETDANSKDANNPDGKIYLDNDGYRIKYYDSNSPEVKAKLVKPGWNRVSNDGTTPLGPDSLPDSGNNAWMINDGKGEETPSNDKAPYKTVDKDGNVTYLDKNGNPINADGTPKTGSDGKPLPKAAFAPKYTDDANHPEAKKTYKGKNKSNYTLNGNVDIQIGKNVLDNGSITVGEMDKDGNPIAGESVSLNPSDSDSHQWKTIKDGKYAGMQVKVSDDNKQIEFRWPVSTGQISDIANGKDGENSPISKDKDGSPSVNLPIKVTKGKGGAGDVEQGSPKEVKISTPWDTANDDSKDPNAGENWWIDASTQRAQFGYAQLGEKNAQDVKIYLTDKLASKVSNDLDNPIAKIDGLKFEWNKTKDGIVQSDDSGKYVSGNVYVEDVNAFEDKEITTGLDFEDVFGKDIKELSGTANSVDVILSKVDKEISFDSYSQNIGDDGDDKVSFKINKTATDVDYSTYDIKALDKDGKEAEWNKIDSIDSATFDIDTKTLSVKFKDNKLSFNDQIKLFVAFKLKSASDVITENKTALVATKNKASTAEQEFKLKSESTTNTFNGSSATWTVDAKGFYVDSPSVKATVTTLGNSEKILSTVNSTTTFDGSNLTITLNNTGDKGPQGKYQINLTYGLNHGFKETFNKTLSVERDLGKDIHWTGDSTSFNYGEGNDVVATLDKSKIKDIDLASIDTAAVSSLNGLVKGTDYNFEFDKSTGKLTVTLLKEQVKGVYNFSVVLMSSTSKQQLNADILNTVKDKAMSTENTVKWVNKSVSFDQNGHSTAVFKAESAGVDVELNKATVSGEDATLKAGLKNNPVWNSNDKTLTVELEKDIPANIYKLNVSFAYKNGYDGNTSDELKANKDAPMDTEARVSFNTTDGSFDGDNTVVYTLSDYGSDVDINSNPEVTLKGRTLPAGILNPSWDSANKKLTITLKGEIPGGNNTLEVTFGLLNGYKGRSVPAEITASKTIPDPTQTENAVWTSDTNVDAPLSDNDDAVFTIDKNKTGQDIDLVNGPEIVIDKANSTNPDNIPQFKKTWDADKGQLTIHFEEAQSKWKAAFKVTFGIGNGYISDKKVDAPEISVEKTKASAYEKQIIVDKKDAGDVTFAPTVNKATWHVSSFGPAVDTSHYTVKITSENAKYKDQGPIDPRLAKVDEDGKVTNEKDAAKDVNKSKAFAIDNLKKNSNGESSADISVAFKDGDLWEGKFDVEITFDLIGYNEKTSTILTFSKLEPDEAESKLEADKDAGIKITGPHTVISWHGGVYSDAVLVLDKFGVDIDYAHPQVQVKGSALTKGWIPNDYNGTKPVEYDSKTGKTTLRLINWKILSAIGEILGSGKTFVISFDIVGFSTKASVELTSK